MQEENLRGKRVRRRLREVQEQKEGRAMAIVAGSLVSLCPTLSLSLSFLTGHPGHLAFPACFFWLATYMAKYVLRFSIAGNLTNFLKIRHTVLQVGSQNRREKL
jgi:hypothetical protein